MTFNWKAIDNHGFISGEWVTRSEVWFRNITLTTEEERSRARGVSVVKAEVIHHRNREAARVNDQKGQTERRRGVTGMPLLHSRSLDDNDKEMLGRRYGC